MLTKEVWLWPSFWGFNKKVGSGKRRLESLLTILNSSFTFTVASPGGSKLPNLIPDCWRLRDFKGSFLLASPREHKKKYPSNGWWRDDCKVLEKGNFQPAMIVHWMAARLQLMPSRWHLIFPMPWQHALSCFFFLATECYVISANFSEFPAGSDKFPGESFWENSVPRFQGNIFNIVMYGSRLGISPEFILIRHILRRWEGRIPMPPNRETHESLVFKEFMVPVEGRDGTTPKC